MQESQHVKPNLMHPSQNQSVIKMNVMNPGEQVSSKDQDGEAVVELIHTYHDGYQKDILHLQEVAHPIGSAIQPTEEGKWKKLCQIRASALTGNCAETLSYKVENGVQNHVTGNLAAQRKNP